MAKVNEAEAVSGKTPEETNIIGQMKSYIGVKSGDASIGGAAGAKAKFANDYAAKKYADVIALDQALGFMRTLPRGLFELPRGDSNNALPLAANG